MFGTLTKTEQQQLEAWKNASSENVDLFQRIAEQQDTSTSYRQYSCIDSQKAWNRFEKQVSRSHQMVGRVFRYAACILFPLLMVAALVYYHHRTPTSEVRVAEVIHPGFSQAILFTDDGVQQVLESSDTVRHHIKAGKGTMAMLKNGEISYQQPVEQVAEKDTVRPDTQLQTQVGNEFRVTLADGTRVHLNYNTTLKYPVVFGKQARIVYLKGEAYFEVAPDADRPFYVVTENMKIKQYGTSFNVNAYSPDHTYVVLVDGSISVLQGEEHHEVPLRPGQKAILHSGSRKVQVENVNVEKYIAWNEGYFHFEDESLEDIMKTLSNWYNVEVVFKSPKLKNLHFTGVLDRNSTISPTIRAIARTVNIKIKVRDRTIILSE